MEYPTVPGSFPYVPCCHFIYNRCGVDKFKTLCKAAGICEKDLKKGLISPVSEAMKAAKCPLNLKEAGIQESHIEAMVEEASKQERLLKNNPAVLSLEDMKKIYYKAFDGKGL